MIKVTYKARSYEPELITGRYIRKNYSGGYLVVEAGTGVNGKVGQGYTLREYITDGEEVPNNIKEQLETITHCHMIQWEI
ncbi:hypothetical protein HPMBJEAJ_00354 [Aeromonas phage avDM6]|nr:hypothetical protein HPMBJEAJ_00354 [Aeromonas phage avDM6]